MDVRQRKTISGGKNSKSFSNAKEPKKSGNHGQSKKKQKTEKQSAFIPYWLVRVWQVLGILAAVTAGYIHAKYMFTLHDNYLWFSHITVSTLPIFKGFLFFFFFFFNSLLWN